MGVAEWTHGPVTLRKCTELRYLEMFKATVDGKSYFTYLLDTCVKPGKKFCNTSLGLRNNDHWYRGKPITEPFGIHCPLPWKWGFFYWNRGSDKLIGWNIHLPHWWVSVEQFYIFTFSFRPSVLPECLCDLFLHTVHWFPRLIMQVFPLPFDTKLNFNSDEGGRIAEWRFCWMLNEIFWELITLQVSCPSSSLNPIPLPGLLFPAKGNSLSPSGCYLFLANNCSLPAPFAFLQGRPLLLIGAWFTYCQKKLISIATKDSKTNRSISHVQLILILGISY